MKIIDTIKAIFNIEELRTRILNTLFFLVIFRLGTYVTLPGLAVQDNVQTEGILGLIDSFLGGAFSNKSIFGLGIMPYISASIVVQLLQVAVPAFQRMQKEGESGRKRMNQITKLLTLAICAVQSIGFMATIPDQDILVNKTLFTISGVIILVAGTMFCMWLGDKITEKGIGNGISLLIMVGIVSRFPAAILAEGVNKGMEGSLFLIIEMIGFFFIVMFVVLITQATRRIPISYAKQIVGNKVIGGQRQYLPLKINSAGVMPIIFAQALMFLPAMIANFWSQESELASVIGTTFSDFTSWQYNLFFAIMIILFTFFYTAITINPREIAESLKRNGGFVPGIKPGEATADYIDDILSKITLPGALFVVAIAITPAFASMAKINSQFAQFYGGTSLLILVGVVLDTIQQVDSFLLMEKYEGMMKSGKVRQSEPTPLNV